MKKVVVSNPVVNLAAAKRGLDALIDEACGVKPSKKPAKFKPLTPKHPGMVKFNEAMTALYEALPAERRALLVAAGTFVEVAAGVMASGNPRHVDIVRAMVLQLETINTENATL